MPERNEAAIPEDAAPVAGELEFFQPPRNEPPPFRFAINGTWIEVTREQAAQLGERMLDYVDGVNRNGEW